MEGRVGRQSIERIDHLVGAILLSGSTWTTLTYWRRHTVSWPSRSKEVVPLSLRHCVRRMPGGRYQGIPRRLLRGLCMPRFKVPRLTVRKVLRPQKQRSWQSTCACATCYSWRGSAPQRQMQVVAGGFVYFCTFRRPLLGALNQVWAFIQSFEGGPFVQQIPDGVRLELSRFCLLSPLARMNFRLALSSTVTASDASTTGGGVTASCGFPR